MSLGVENKNNTAVPITARMLLHIACSYINMDAFLLFEKLIAEHDIAILPASLSQFVIKHSWKKGNPLGAWSYREINPSFCFVFSFQSHHFPHRQGTVSWGRFLKAQRPPTSWSARWISCRVRSSLSFVSSRRYPWVTWRRSPSRPGSSSFSSALSPGRPSGTMRSGDVSQRLCQIRYQFTPQIK